MQINITPGRVTGTTHTYECPKGGCDWSYVAAYPQGPTDVKVHSMMTVGEIETAVKEAVAARDQDFRDRVEARVLGHILESHLTAHMSTAAMAAQGLSETVTRVTEQMSALAAELREMGEDWYNRSDVTKRSATFSAADSLITLAEELDG